MTTQTSPRTQTTQTDRPLAYTERKYLLLNFTLNTGVQILCAMRNRRNYLLDSWIAAQRTNVPENMTLWAEELMKLNDACLEMFGQEVEKI